MDWRASKQFWSVAGGHGAQGEEVTEAGAAMMNSPCEKRKKKYFPHSCIMELYTAGSIHFLLPFNITNGFLWQLRG